MFPFIGTSHTIFPVKSFALLNVAHTVRRKNCVAKAVDDTQFYVVTFAQGGLMQTVFKRKSCVIVH